MLSPRSDCSDRLYSGRHRRAGWLCRDTLVEFTAYRTTRLPCHQTQEPILCSNPEFHPLTLRRRTLPGASPTSGVLNNLA
jgi:hypothetical protein